MLRLDSIAVTKALSHGPGRSIPMFRGECIPLGYPGVPFCLPIVQKSFRTSSMRRGEAYRFLRRQSSSKESGVLPSIEVEVGGAF